MAHRIDIGKIHGHLRGLLPMMTRAIFWGENKITEKTPGDPVGTFDTIVGDSLCKFLPTIVDCEVISEDVSNRPKKPIVLPTDGRRVWVVDPGDGTVNIASGLKSCGVMISLVENGEVVFSCIFLPGDEQAMGSGFYYAGKNSGVWQWTPERTRHLFVNKSDNLKDTLLLVEGKSTESMDSAFLNKLKKAAPRHRSNFSCAVSFIALASGGWWPRGSGMLVTFHNKFWDNLAGRLFVPEAGGKIVDWFGKPSPIDNNGDEIFYNGNEALLAQALSKHVCVSKHT